MYRNMSLHLECEVKDAADREMHDAGYGYGEFDSRRMLDSDHEEDEYDLCSEDTSSSQARRGKDIQGIPWDCRYVPKKTCRLLRLEQYKNYECVLDSGKNSEKVSKQTQKGGNYYEFRRNTRHVYSNILHFQLRSLIWATSKHDVYLISEHSVHHWSGLTSKKKDVLDFTGPIVPSERHQGNLSEGFQQIRISTMAVKNNFLAVGGFQGELVCKYIDRPGISFCARMSYEENSITNDVQIYDSLSGSLHLMTSNNDCIVRDFDVEKFQLSNLFHFQWPVNHTSVSPDGKQIVVVGDSTDGVLVDSQSGKAIHELKGHLDHSFASAWHPDGQTFATGNQDMTCRVWDTRNLTKSLAVLRGHLGAIRSIRFTSDGQYMAMAESADFVHIFDVKGGYERRQEVDIFGEISGISFSPDTEALFISIWDRTYSSLLQFSRCHNYSYLYSMI